MLPNWIVELAKQAQQAALYRLMWTLPGYVVAGILLAAILIVAVAESTP